MTLNYQTQDLYYNFLDFNFFSVILYHFFSVYYEQGIFEDRYTFSLFFFKIRFIHKLSPFSHKLTNAVPEIALVVKKEVVFITAFIIVFIWQHDLLQTNQRPKNFSDLRYIISQEMSISKVFPLYLCIGVMTFACVASSLKIIF